MCALASAVRNGSILARLTSESLRFAQDGSAFFGVRRNSVGDFVAGSLKKRNIWVDMGGATPYVVVRLLVTFPRGNVKGNPV